MSNQTSIIWMQAKCALSSVDTTVADNYGHTVLAIEFDEDFKRVMPRMINKEGNYNRNVGNGIELVIENHVQPGEFYMNALEAVIH